MVQVVVNNLLLHIGQILHNHRVVAKSNKRNVTRVVIVHEWFYTSVTPMWPFRSTSRGRRNGKMQSEQVRFSQKFNAENVVHDVDDFEQQTTAEAEAANNMNYFLVVIFYYDVEMRPCSPIIRLISLQKVPELLADHIHANPRGEELQTISHLGDLRPGPHKLPALQTNSILNIFALKITNAEAVFAESTISCVNAELSKNCIHLTERTNLAILPRVLHTSFFSTFKRLSQIQEVSSCTDVQLGIMLVRECTNSGRSIHQKLNSLHPFMATPENFHGVLSAFMRPIDIRCFSQGFFKFMGA